MAWRRSDSSAPRLHSRIHVRLEKAICAAAVELGPVHGQVRILQQLIRVGPIVRGQGDADAGVGDELVTAGFVRLPDRVADSIHQVDDVQWLRHGAVNDREFVAAQPRNDIRLSETTAQASGHGFQQLIADRMAERVVDALEMIEIEIQQRQVLALMNPLERLLELLAEQHPIGQVGQRIVVRQVRDALIRTFALRHVLDHAEQILRLPASIADDEPL